MTLRKRLNGLDKPATAMDFRMALLEALGAVCKGKNWSLRMTIRNGSKEVTYWAAR